jgi:hypothetical protein
MDRNPNGKLQMNSGYLMMWAVAGLFVSACQSREATWASCVQALPFVGSLCPTLTVGDVEDCADAIGADLCAISTAPACANLRRCRGG